MIFAVVAPGWKEETGEGRGVWGEVGNWEGEVLLIDQEVFNFQFSYSHCLTRRAVTVRSLNIFETAQAWHCVYCCFMAFISWAIRMQKLGKKNI